MTDAAATELRIPLARTTLSAKRWGDPSMPPLLAVHGWLDNAASFDALAPLLLANHHIIAIDLVGHGRSGWRPAGSWDHWVDHLGDIQSVVDHFGWSRVDLLGHSMGATLVSSYAGALPERVGRLLLIEGLGPLASAVENTRTQVRKGLLGRAGLGGRGLRLFASIDDAAQARVKANGLSLKAARSLVERGLDDVVGDDGVIRYRWSSDPRLALPSVQRFSEPQVADVLAGIVAPTLLILAEPAAPYLSPATMQRRVEQVASIECLRMAGNHHLHLEDPRPVADAIIDFVERHPLDDAAEAKPG